MRRWKAGECGELWREAVEWQRARKSRQPKKRRRKRAAAAAAVGEIDDEEDSLEVQNAKRCKTLVKDGQYSKAIQALVSHGMAEHTEATLKEMQDKHPAATRPLPPIPVTDTPPKTFGSLEIVKAALSFRKGTAPGPSGLRPEHLQVAMKCSPSTVANKAQVALTKLVNVMAKGKVPSTVAPYFCGARLHAAKKRDNTLRPIAVGNLLRRLGEASKKNTVFFLQKNSEILRPPPPPPLSNSEWPSFF